MGRNSKSTAPSPLPFPRRGRECAADKSGARAYHASPMAETTQVIYSMTGVSKMHEKKHILKDIYLSYYYGAKIGVLGLNGSGKSTLLKIMAGIDKNYEGQITRSQNYTIGFLPQEPHLDESMTVKQAVEIGMKHVTALMDEYHKVNDELGDPKISPERMDKLLARSGELQEKLDSVNAWDLDNQLEQAMDALRCPPGDTPIKIISGGEKRRVALCQLLLQKPDILLLDEPTNHLDAESVAWLEQYLQRYEGTVIAVTHDRYFLDNVAGWILELDRGQGIPFKGNYTSWLEQKEKRLGVEQKQEDSRRKALAHELEWVRSSPKARQAKSKARLKAYEQMAAQDAAKKVLEIEIYIPPGPRLGALVIQAEGLTKSYGEKLLLDKVSFTLPPNAIVGIIGPNGAGKTTLFKMIIGVEKPDAGTIRLGDSVKLAYIEQTRDALGTEQSVWNAISDGQEFMQLGAAKVNSRAYVSRFGFNGTDQSRSVGTLSGGERNRVHLARMLKSGANVLLLDEPTNDLDVNTMRALEEALENFAGCAVVISHDRWFLDRIATHILAFEGDSKVTFFEGNFTDYEVDRHKRMGTDADRPHRITYRKLTAT
jgi:energy-dependent translational throttle protein EttA